MKSTFIQFMTGIIDSRYSNWGITRVLGRVVPIMMKLIVEKSIDETKLKFDRYATYFSYDLLSNICGNRSLTSKAIAVCAGAELTGDLCLGIILQEDNNGDIGICEKLMEGIFQATHEVVKIGPEPKEEGELQEEDLRLSADDVAVFERVLKATEENMDDKRIQNRCMSCITKMVKRARSWHGMVVNLYLDQQEELYMRVMKVYFDRRFTDRTRATTEIETLKNQVWYDVNDRIRSPEECSTVTDKLLHYLKLISTFPVTSVTESDVMSSMQLNLISYVGYITAGVHELYEEGQISGDELQVGKVVYVGRESSVVDSIDFPMLIGQEVIVQSVDGNVVQVTESSEVAGVQPAYGIPIEHLREPVDQTTSGEMKYSWNPEFEEMLAEYFTNENPDVRRKAFLIPTTYGSKSEWSSLHSNVSRKIRMKQKKSKGVKV